MVNPLEMLARAQPPRRGVVVYAPGRGIPQRPAPTRRTGGQRVPARAARERTTGVDWSAVENAFAGARQRKAEEQAQQQAQAEQPWYKKGLATIVGNPVVATALKPLEALDHLRRGSVLGYEQAALAAPEWLEELPGFNVLKGVDEERVREDPRSNLQKFQDPTYGFGQIAPQTGNQWVNRGVGLAGDVALDPLTYLTLGTAKAVSGGGRVAMQAGRNARAGELAALSARLSPEALQELAPDIARAGQRGLGTASPALREAMGISAPQLRFAGAGIPGSQRIAEPLARAGGAIRAATTGRVANPLARGPKGLEAALGTITRGTNEMEIPKALTNVRLTQDIRRGEGAFTTRGNRMISNVYRDAIKGKDQTAIRQMIRDTEQGLDTPLKGFFDEVQTVYKDVSGRDLAPFMRERYFPHVMTGGARRMLRKALDKGDPVVKEMEAKGWFATDDLLEGSGFLERARQLTPNPDGSPKTLTIGGKELTITEGTLDEVNAEVAKLFPGFKGKFYEDDPIKVMESYVSSVARQAGRDKALGIAAAGPTDLVQRIEGPLADELAQRNDQLATRTPMVEEINQGFTKGAPLRAVPEGAPPVEPTDIFRSREMTGKTTERNQALIKKGTAYRKAAQAEARDLRDTAAESIRDVKQNMMKGLRDEAKANSPRIKQLDVTIKHHNDTLKKLGPYKEEMLGELTAFMVGIRRDIADLEDEIRRVNTTFKGKLTKEQNRIERKLRASLETMKDVSRRANERLAAAPREAQEAARKRIDELMRPVEKVRANIRATAARVPGKVDPERLTWAHETISKGKSVAHVDALREQYRAALQNVERIRVRNNSKLPTFVQEQLDTMTAAQQRAFRAAMKDDLTQAGMQADQIARQIEEAVPVSQYDLDWDELQQLKTSPSPETARRRSTLERMFRQGGKHSDEKRARAILKDHLTWEKRIAQATKDDMMRLRSAELQVVNSPEMAQAAGLEQRIVRAAEQDAEAKAQRLAAEEASVARMDEGFNPERDIEAPQRINAQRDEVIEPLAQQRDVATNLRDEVRLDTYRRISEVDRQTTQTQLNLARDTYERINLVNNRAKAEKRLKTTQKVKPGAWKPVPEQERMAADLLGVAQANPRLDDDALNATESLLGSAAEALERSKQLDIRAQDVSKIVDAAYKGELAPIMLTTVNDGWRMLHDGPLQSGDIIVDAELYRRYELLYEGMKDPKLGGRVLNAFTNLFKTYATLSPGFHVRNAMSAWFMNTSDGVPQKLQLEGAKLWQQFMKGGEGFLAKQPEDIRLAFEAAMGSGAGGRFTEAGVAQSADSRLYDRLARNRATRWSQRQGERVEGGVRLGMALDSIRRGESPQQALDRITRIHFDYGQVSKLDEQAKRIVPFWTFMSRNMPLQVTQMWTKPRLYAAYNSMIRNFSTEPEQYTPQYWLDAGAFNTGEQVNGLPLYLQPDLGHTRLGGDIKDIEDFLSGENLGGLLSNVNPILSAPVEFAMKRDAFTGREFGPEDYSEMSGPLGLPARGLATVLGQTNEAGQVSDNFMNVVRSLNPLQDRSARLLPQLSGGDPEAVKRQPESIARFLGLPVRTLTPEQQRSEYFRRYYDMLAEQDRIQKMLETQAGR